ncbi:MAG: hypothetical protein HY827_04115 [Actinobacteria bacterium]|nr:hypothetical protein [Actinomycetota bacterium]
MARVFGFLKPLVCLVYLAAVIPQSAAAASSDFDPTFGAGGKLTHSVVPGDDTAFAAALQSDGKLILAGRAYVSSRYQSSVARLNSDGTLDSTFAGDGDLWTSIGSTRDVSYAAYVQPDGKILVAGITDAGPKDDMGLIRFNADGTLDSTFGSGTGKAYYWFGSPGSSNAHAYAMAVQSDGKIVIAGDTETGGTQDFAVIRANGGGGLDSTFGSGGRVYTPIGSSNDTANAVIVQPDGKIVVAGQADNGGAGFDFAIARYNSDGTLDASFDGDGIVTADFGTDDQYINSIAVRPDGSILAAGYSQPGSVEHVVIVRYTATGALDTTFGVGGVVNTFAPGGESRANEIALQNNDKFVVAGTFYDGTYTDHFVAQYLASGALDTSFDGDGMLITGAVGADEHGEALAIGPDGKIVVVGDTYIGSNYDMTAMRLVGEPQLVPVPPMLKPTSSIVRPKLGKTRAKRLKAFAGTAGPTDEVAKVEVALRRVDRRALRKKRCLWLRNSKAKFVRTRATGKRCSVLHFLPASGGATWSYKLRRELPKGRYELSVRVTLTNGSTQTAFEAANGNYRLFTVT